MIEEILRVDQQSYKLFIESVKDFAIIMMDPAGYVTSWNRGAEEIKGYTENEIKGVHFSIFYTAEDIKKGVPEKNIIKAIEKGRVDHEGWRLRKDGSRFWASVVITCLKDKQGIIIGFGKVTRDMTRQMQLEEEIKQLNKTQFNQLKKSESELVDYKQALDESAIVATTDQKGLITYVNDKFCKISKYSREELIGQDHRIINSAYHSKEFIQELWVTIANGKIWRGEIKNRAKDGSYYWVDTTIVPFLNEKGKPYQYVAIRSDVTKRKLAEEQILEINEELEKKIRERTFELTEALEREKELNEMKSRFVSMASHEFRTPLTAILSSISLVEHYNDQENDEKRHKHINRIKSSVKNLTDLLDDFLSLDKLEQGKVEVSASDFNVQEFVEDIVEEMEGMFSRKNQVVKCSFAGSMDVRNDKKILKNILLNLLSNAIKYSDSGMEIHVAVNATNEKVTIAVEDKGMGIPAEAQTKMFTKFFRANNATTIQGTGLGLNIVKRYVELLNGDIFFKSKENEGTTFTVQFARNLS